MASINTWKKLRYFNPNSKFDKWGDASAISETLLYRLDDFRHYLGLPIYVTSGVRNKGNSFHNPKRGACAVDVVIPGYLESPIDLILAALRFEFTGLGFYPHWRFNGEIVGGLHLDTRPLDADGKAAQWMGILNHEGKQVYTDLTLSKIIRYAMLDDNLIQYLN